MGFVSSIQGTQATAMITRNIWKNFYKKKEIKSYTVFTRVHSTCPLADATLELKTEYWFSVRQEFSAVTSVQSSVTLGDWPNWRNMLMSVMRRLGACG